MDAALVIAPDIQARAESLAGPHDSACSRFPQDRQFPDYLNPCDCSRRERVRAIEEVLEKRDREIQRLQRAHAKASDELLKRNEQLQQRWEAAEARAQEAEAKIKDLQAVIGRGLYAACNHCGGRILEAHARGKAEGRREGYSEAVEDVAAWIHDNRIGPDDLASDIRTGFVFEPESGIWCACGKIDVTIPRPCADERCAQCGEPFRVLLAQPTEGTEK